MRYNDYNDNELIDLINENEEANEILFEKYKPLIIGIAKRKYDPNVSNGFELNDLISEGMIGFSTAINTFKTGKEASFFTYAKTCIERKITSALLSSTRQKHKALNESITIEDDENINFGLKKVLGDDSLNPEKLMITAENTKELLESLDKQLSTSEKQVFELKKSGFEIQEIGDILDKDYKSVDNTLQRIKIKIKNYLKEKEN